MTFQELFEHYYSLYRGESTAPASTDPEWTLAWRYYNDALNRLVKMDDTKWSFLFATLQGSTQVSPALVRTLQSSVTSYTAPTDMMEPGGYVTYVDSAGNRTNLPVLRPHEVQSVSPASVYAYFTGDEQSGFTLHTNPTPSTAQVGQSIDYVYYRKPTYLTSTEDGTSLVEAGDPAFYYNHMLAQRYRVSRNYPSYQTALRDSEEALKGMKLKNNSGYHYNSWTMASNSNSTGGWGV